MTGKSGWVGLLGSTTARVRKLAKLDFEFHRHAAGSHEIWHNPITGRYTTIPNHPGDMPEGTLRAILRAAGVTPERFLQS